MILIKNLFETKHKKIHRSVIRTETTKTLLTSTQRFLCHYMQHYYQKQKHSCILFSFET